MKRQLPSRHLAWAALAAASAALLVGCGGGEPDSAAEGKPRPATSATAGPSPSPRPSVSADRPKLGAMDTVLVYCSPVLHARPVKGCDLGRISDGVKEITQPIRKQVKASTDEKKHADVLAAAEGLEKAVEELKPCGAWFERQGSHEADDASCSQSWGALTRDWQALKKALPWP